MLAITIPAQDTKYGTKRVLVFFFIQSARLLFFFDKNPLTRKKSGIWKAYISIPMQSAVKL
jgi:hypothetical protein